MHGCDRYIGLYPGFEHFFRKYWPEGLPIQYFVITEEVDYESDLFTTIKSGKGEWSDRLANAINQIPVDYLIYFQEDFWLTTKVEKSFLENLIEIEKTIGESISLVKLHSGYESDGTVASIGGHDLLRVSKRNSEYLLSHQVSLWSKQFLLSCLRPGESAWENELLGTERLRKQEGSIYFIDISERYYLPVSAKGKFNENVTHFFGELEIDSPYRARLIRSYNRGIHHGELDRRGTSPIRIISLKNRLLVRLNKILRGIQSLITWRGTQSR